MTPAEAAERSLAHNIVATFHDASQGQYGGAIVVIVNESATEGQEGTLEIDGASKASIAFTETGGAMIMEFIKRANAALRQIAKDLGAESGGRTVDRSAELAAATKTATKTE